MDSYWSLPPNVSVKGGNDKVNIVKWKKYKIKDATWEKQSELIKDIGKDIFNHYWLKLPDGRILDPTASQFKTPEGEEMPKMYLGEKPKWYKLKKNKNGNNSRR